MARGDSARHMTEAWFVVWQGASSQNSNDYTIVVDFAIEIQVPPSPVEAVLPPAMAW